MISSKYSNLNTSLTSLEEEPKPKKKVGYFPYRKKLFELTEVGNGLTEEERLRGPKFGAPKEAFLQNWKQ